jgi:hypothetical protein
MGSTTQLGLRSQTTRLYERSTPETAAGRGGRVRGRHPPRRPRSRGLGAPSRGVATRLRRPIERLQFGRPWDLRISSLGWVLFARRYWGRPGWFLFLRLSICLNSPGDLARPRSRCGPPAVLGADATRRGRAVPCGSFGARVGRGSGTGTRPSTGADAALRPEASRGGRAYGCRGRDRNLSRAAPLLEGIRGPRRCTRRRRVRGIPNASRCGAMFRRRRSVGRTPGRDRGCRLRSKTR